MSVINQMLKDLEQRRGVSEHGRYVPAGHRGQISWLIWLPCSLLLGIGAGLWFWSQIKGPSVPAVAAPVSATVGSLTPSAAVATISVPVSSSGPVRQMLSAAVSAPSSNLTLPVSATVTASVTTVAGAGNEAREESGGDEAPLTSDDDLYVNQQKSSLVEENGPPGDIHPIETTTNSDEVMIEEAPVTGGQPVDELQIEEVTLSPAEEAALQRRRAEQAMAKGDLPKARESFSALLQATPLDHQAREKLAGLLFGAGDDAGARRVLEQGVALAPGYANYRLLLARMEMSAGQKSRALARLRDCEPEVRSNLDFYATRAALAQELGDYPLAASSYQRLTLQQPAEGRWWLGLGISYEKAGRPQAALDAYRRAEMSAGLSAPSREFVRQRRIRLEQTP